MAAIGRVALIIVIAIIIIVIAIAVVSTYTVSSQKKTVPTFSMSGSTVSAVNSTLGLSLQLFAAPSNLSGSLAISAQVVNFRNVSNNVTGQDNWSYPVDSLNPSSPCDSPGEVGFGIFQGYYDQSNYTKATTLTLYNPTFTYLCTTQAFPNTFYSFQPHSDLVEIAYAGSLYNETISLFEQIGGYWSGEYATGTYHVFPTGSYTIIAADEWGQVVLLHFVVIPRGN